MSQFSNHRAPLLGSIALRQHLSVKPYAYFEGIPYMKIAVLVSFALLHSAIAQSQAATSDPIKTVQTKFDAFDRHDVAAIESIYAVDAALQSPDYPQLSGNAKIAQTYQQLFDAIPDAKDTDVVLDRTANRVYAQFFLTGHLKSSEMTAVKIRIISVYTVQGDRIVSDSTYYDRKVTR
jgi:ketosteroid isomerase-like protein